MPPNCPSLCPRWTSRVLAKDSQTYVFPSITYVYYADSPLHAQTCPGIGDDTLPLPFFDTLDFMKTQLSGVLNTVHTTKNYLYEGGCGRVHWRWVCLLSRRGVAPLR